jgi:hypothetical protein
MDSVKVMELSRLLRWLNLWNPELASRSVNQEVGLLNSSLRCPLEPVATFCPVPLGGEETGRTGPLLPFGKDPGSSLA